MKFNSAKFRVDLRALFAWTTYAIFGFAIGTNPADRLSRDAAWGEAAYNLVSQTFQPLLTAASAAIIVGLLKQVKLLRTQATTTHDRDLRRGARCEACFRAALAALLAFCLVSSALVVRGIQVLPYNDTISDAFAVDVMTGYAWWLAIVVALNDASSRMSVNRTGWRKSVVHGLAGAFALVLGIYLVIEVFYVVYLTHAACRSVDLHHPPEYHRYPTLTNLDQWLLSALPAAAVAAAVIAGIASLRAFSKHGLRGPFRRRTLTPIVLLLTASGSYTCWYYVVGHDYYSPDFADVEASANWWQVSGSMVLVALAITYVAYRAWRAHSPPDSLQLEIEDFPPAGEQGFAITAVFAAPCTYLVQLILASLGYAGNFSSAFDVLLNLAAAPFSLLLFAMLLQAARLARLRWQGSGHAPLVVIPFRLREFAAAWLLMAVIAAIAIPTFAAFSFSFWLGPWYRW